jgi:hypothetical protein
VGTNALETFLSYLIIQPESRFIRYTRQTHWTFITIRFHLAHSIAHTFSIAHRSFKRVRNKSVRFQYCRYVTVLTSWTGKAQSSSRACPKRATLYSHRVNRSPLGIPRSLRHPFPVKSGSHKYLGLHLGMIASTRWRSISVRRVSKERFLSALSSIRMEGW